MHLPNVAIMTSPMQPQGPTHFRPVDFQTHVDIGNFFGESNDRMLLNFRDEQGKWWFDAIGELSWIDCCDAVQVLELTVSYAYCPPSPDHEENEHLLSRPLSSLPSAMSSPMSFLRSCQGDERRESIASILEDRKPLQIVPSTPRQADAPWSSTLAIPEANPTAADPFAAMASSRASRLRPAMTRTASADLINSGLINGGIADLLLSQKDAEETQRPPPSIPRKKTSPYLPEQTEGPLHTHHPTRSVDTAASLLAVHSTSQRSRPPPLHLTSTAKCIAVERCLSNTPPIDLEGQEAAESRLQTQSIEPSLRLLGSTIRLGVRRRWSWDHTAAGGQPGSLWHDQQFCYNPKEPTESEQSSGRQPDSSSTSSPTASRRHSIDSPGHSRTQMLLPDSPFLVDKISRSGTRKAEAVLGATSSNLHLLAPGGLGTGEHVYEGLVISGPSVRLNSDDEGDGDEEGDFNQGGGKEIRAASSSVNPGGRTKRTEGSKKAGVRRWIGRQKSKALVKAHAMPSS